MRRQPDIDTTMRHTVVEWLVEVAEEYGLQSQTLCLCVNIKDRFCQQKNLIEVNCSCLVLQRCLLLRMYCTYLYYLHNAIHSMVCAVTKSPAVYVMS